MPCSLQSYPSRAFLFVLASACQLLVFSRLPATAQTSTAQLQLYVNGHLEATVPYGAAWSASGHTVVGRSFYGGTPTDFVNGLVGDVRLYDHALTPAQIKALYAQGPSLHWQTKWLFHFALIGILSANLEYERGKESQ